MVRSEPLRVEVFWQPEQGPAQLRQLCLPAGASLADAVRASAIVLPDASWETAGGALRLAVFGVLKPATAALHDGDRVDVTRGLRVDPKEARRRRARAAPKR
jgi:putative ubiquitin-RnfH superfamily antitoxin RatB of RatAB toxin-antitoxin module